MGDFHNITTMPLNSAFIYSDLGVYLVSIVYVLQFAAEFGSREDAGFTKCFFFVPVKLTV